MLESKEIRRMSEKQKGNTMEEIYLKSKIKKIAESEKRKSINEKENKREDHTCACAHYSQQGSPTHACGNP
jgi:hypothetical protein